MDDITEGQIRSQLDDAVHYCQIERKSIIHFNHKLTDYIITSEDQKVALM